jgi:hypothetical protein
VEAPPSSPSSDRSVGDGSSCDTPTSRSSLSEDGKSNNGKYCDCCYCEFFGHSTVSFGSYFANVQTNVLQGVIHLFIIWEASLPVKWRTVIG